MQTLRNGYFGTLRVPGYGRSDNGQDDQPLPALAMTFMPFVDYVNIQVDRRIEVLSKARNLNREEVESGAGVEEQEEALEKV